MKKRKNQHKIDSPAFQNPVAKFAHQFNKAQVFCDKSKYSRKAKHSKQEVAPIVLARMIRATFCFNDV